MKQIFTHLATTGKINSSLFFIKRYYNCAKAYSAMIRL
jgi:hypothetical protein